jgi:hypothetical protein
MKWSTFPLSVSKIINTSVNFIALFKKIVNIKIVNMFFIFIPYFVNYYYLHLSNILSNMTHFDYASIFQTFNDLTFIFLFLLTLKSKLIKRLYNLL